MGWYLQSPPPNPQPSPQTRSPPHPLTRQASGHVHHAAAREVHHARPQEGRGGLAVPQPPRGAPHPVRHHRVHEPAQEQRVACGDSGQEGREGWGYQPKLKQAELNQRSTSVGKVGRRGGKGLHTIVQEEEEQAGQRARVPVLGPPIQPRSSHPKPPPCKNSALAPHPAASTRAAGLT